MTEQKQSVKLIRKSNDLVEARYKFNIWEMRIFTKMLTMIRREDEDFKEYRIYLKDIIHEFNLQKDNASYDWLKDGATRLMKKIITVVRQTEEGEMEFQTPIIAGVDSFVNRKQAKYIDISFHPKMKPFLLQLRSQFLMYDVRNILRLPSVYSIRVYELLKQYEKIGRRKIKVQELKEILGIEDKYKLYGHFKKRVIVKSQKDLEQYCDIRFEFEEQKAGRKVESLIFYIFSNKPGEKVEEAEVIEELTVTPPNAKPKQDDLLTTVQAWGVTATSLKKWIKEFGQAQVEGAAELTLARLKKSKLDNPGAYFYKIVRASDTATMAAAAKRAKKEQKEKREAAKRRELELEIKVSEIKRAKSRREGELADQIFSENPAAEEQAKQQARASRFSGFDTSLTMEENYQNNPFFRSAVISVLRKQFPSEFEKIELQFKKEMAHLRRDFAEN